MKNKIADLLLNIFDEMMPIDWVLPTNIDYKTHISIEYGADEKNYIVFKFADNLSKDLRQICSGYLVDPTQINEFSFTGLTLMRLLVHPSITIAPGNFEFVSYSYTSQVFREGLIPAGEILASIQTDELKIGFITKDYSGKAKYLDPAIIIRILAVFNEPYAELLKQTLTYDWNSFFSLDRFLHQYDIAKLGSARKLLLKEALSREYYAVKELQESDDSSHIILIDPDMEIFC